MAKHPVPKKKTSKARGSRRYKAFQNKARRRLTEAIQLVKCPSCGDMIRAHHACNACGSYRGKDLKAKAAPAAPEATAKKKGPAKKEEVKTIKAD